MSINLENLTIVQAHKALKEKEYTVRELTDAYLAEIEKKNEELNAYLHIFKGIDAQVKIAEEMFAAGAATELTGIPMAIKANLQVKGEVCNAGSKILENYVAVYDATAITKLRAQGVVFLGSANMDEFAMGSSTENSAYGVTKNPHDTERVPGGSSGGSAAAVAGNLALAALGTDTGGSIRQPASFCGLAGYKGTYGSVSRYGATAMGSSLDQIGPLAKNAEDAKLIWDAMKGQDGYDMTTLANETWENKASEVKGKIAVPKNFLEGVESAVLEVFNKSIEKLKAAGVEVEEIDIPTLEYALPVYYIVMPAEVSSNLARFDGIRYGMKKEGMNSIDEYIQTRSAGFGTEVKRRIILGTYILSAGYNDQYYTKALALREKMKTELAEVFEKYDAIFTPTSPTLPFKIGEKSDDPMAMYLADIFTVGANIAGVPSISINAGKVSDLPVGVQLMGAHGEDYKIFELAKKLEK